MAVLGSNPFEFTDPDGKQISVPLAALNFNAGKLELTDATWPPFSGYSADTQTLIGNFLQDLSTNQVFKAPPAVVPKPAMNVTAADPGSAGNNITVAIVKKPSPDLDPTKTTFDITVIETEVYTGLTTATIEAVVGTDLAPGSQPGLAHVLDGSLDETLLPVAQSVTFPTATAGVKATVDIEDGTPDVVFTLEARKAGPGSQFATATITDVDNVANTFTLTLKWEQKLTGAKQLSDLAPLSDEISATDPTNGTFSIPATTAAPVALSGGSETEAASAVLFN